MRHTQSAALRRTASVALAAGAALALAACSTPSGGDGGGGEEETLQIAYISFAVANTYDEPMLAEAQRVADENNAELTVFDGNLDPNTQVSLIQDVIATSDQGLQGAIGAIEAAGKNTADFLFVGYGGSKWGQEHVADGTVFADVVQAPATEGRLGMEALIDALRNGNKQGDVDPFADFPNNGVMTKDTADQFTGEWAG
jgi:ABC-type sugar transport system substrate-binding protein